MNKLNELERLSRITDTGLSAAQAELQKLNMQEAVFKHQLRDLTQRKPATTDIASPAIQAGADVRWQAWADTRRESINLEIARLRVLKEAAQQKLRTAFGKDQAMKQLIRKQKALAMLKEKRQVS